MLAGAADLPSQWSRVACEYTASSRNALTLHMVTAHGARLEVGRCINSDVCSVCGLSFRSITAAKEHVLDKSKLRKLNLLVRGPWMSDEEVVEVSVAAATSSQEQKT